MQRCPEVYGLPKGWKLDAPTLPFDEILKVIEGLSPEAQAKLKDQVDWAEELDDAAARGWTIVNWRHRRT